MTTDPAGTTRADLLFADGTHWYWSTHCRHGNHGKCAAAEFPGGGRRNPSQCKECAAPCRCECHVEAISEGEHR